VTLGADVVDAPSPEIRSAWPTRKYDPARPRLDVPNWCPRNHDGQPTQIFAHLQRRIQALYTERRTSWWGRRFAHYFGEDRRGERLEAIVLVLSAMWYRCDLVTRNVFKDAPNSFRGITIDDYGRACELTVDRVNEALADIKSAGGEFFHWSAPRPGARRRRHPSAQPREQKDRRPDDPFVPGLPFYAKPAIRCLNLELLATIFDCQLAMSMARKKAGDVRKLEPHRGPPKKVRRLRRTREHLPPRRRRSTPGSGLHQLGLPAVTVGQTTAELLPQILDRAISNAEGWGIELPPLELAKPEHQAAIERSQFEAIKFEVRAEIRQKLGHRYTGPPPPELDDEAIEAEARRRFDLRKGAPF
jgi:hypothetical protein